MDESNLSFDNMSMWMESCALTGAAAFFAGMKGCAVIVNGPLWCYLFTQRHIEQTQSDISHRMQCTQLDNDAIVFGAERRICARRFSRILRIRLRCLLSSAAVRRA